MLQQACCFWKDVTICPKGISFSLFSRNRVARELVERVDALRNKVLPGAAVFEMASEYRSLCKNVSLYHAPADKDSKNRAIGKILAFSTENPYQQTKSRASANPVPPPALRVFGTRPPCAALMKILSALHPAAEPGKLYNLAGTPQILFFLLCQR